MNKDLNFYKDTLNSQLQFIEGQCLRALRIYRTDFQSNLTISDENEAVALFNSVIDILKNQDYLVLRKYRGKANLRNYLSAIISKEVVNMIRRKRGRTREKTRIANLGQWANSVNQYCFDQGLSAQAAQREIKKKDGVEISVPELERMKDKISGIRGKKIPGNNKFGALKNGYSSGEEKELVAIAEKANNPETRFIHSSSREKVEQILADIIHQLSREERLLLKLRFPHKGQEMGLDIDTISKILNIKNKTVYTRINRLLKKCKKYMEERGICAEDYFFEEKG